MSMLLSSDALIELYCHMEWADAQVWRVALTLGNGAVDDRLRALLLHAHIVQRVLAPVDWATCGLSGSQRVSLNDVSLRVGEAVLHRRPRIHRRLQHRAVDDANRDAVGSGI